MKCVSLLIGCIFDHIRIDKSGHFTVSFSLQNQLTNELATSLSKNMTLVKWICFYSASLHCVLKVLTKLELLMNLLDK